MLVWKVTRNTVIFLLVIIFFILILLLPKEMEMEGLGGLRFQADYPFTLELYEKNITEFISHFQTEKGFGTTKAGMPLTEHMRGFLKRSLKVIIPSFLISMGFGTAFGVLLFYIRNKRRGRVFSFLSWMLTSIPDFFLFISVQYGLIVAMKNGFPKFNLYSGDDWYSFILPCLSLTLFPLFHMVKVTAVAMENEAGEEYVQTALSKGMSRGRVVMHIFWNAWSTIVNQSQMVMLYILSSLPIIEKLANYNGAGYQLLESILKNDAILSLLFFLPFLFLMYVIVMLAQLARGWLLPKDVGSI